MSLYTWAELCSPTVPSAPGRGRSAGHKAEFIGRGDVAKACDFGREIDVSRWHQRA